MKCAFWEKASSWVDAHPGKAATFASWIAQGVGLGSAMLSVPLIMHAYGDKEPGMWYFLLGWATFFQLCDFGFSQSISRQVSFTNATGKGGERPPNSLFLAVRGPRAIAQLYVSTRWLFRWISLVIAVVAILAERTVLFSGKLQASPEASLCWYIIAAMAIVGNEARVPATILSGCFQVARVRLAAAFVSLFQNALFLTALICRAPMWLAASIFLAGSIANLFFTSRIFREKCPQPNNPRPKIGVIRAIWRMSWQQGIATTASWFIFSVNPMVVGYWLGEAAVTALAVPTRMAMMIFSILSEISAPQLNFMVRLIGDNDIPGLLRKFFLSFLFTALPGLFAYIAFASLGTPFIHWWTLGKVLLAPMVLVWLALYCWLALLQIQAACFVTAHGRQPFALAAVCGAVLNISLDCVLIPKYGLAGATLATFIAQLLTGNWVVIWLAGQHLKGYSVATPGIVVASLKNAISEARTLHFLKKL